MLQFIVASAILVPIIGVTPTWAQMIRIPNSEMPGRERERFVDPPAPKSQPGAWLTPPLSQVQPAPKRWHRPPAKPKQ
jgi:hypothetical protein